MTTPLVHLSFENDSGGQAFNSGTEAHGTFVGTPVYEDISELTRLEGKGLLFDRISGIDKITFPPSANYDFGSFSISGFVKAASDDDSSASVILQQAYNENDSNHSGDRTGWQCIYYRHYFYCNLYSLGDVQNYLEQMLTDDNKLSGFHYSFTYNPITTDFKMYINGVLEKTANIDTLIPDSLHRFAFGGIFNGNDLIDNPNTVQKVIADELYVFDFELNAKEVADLYRQNKARVSAKAIILAKVKGGIPKNKIKAETNMISLLELVNASMNYRLDKGIALTDEEIERNFTFSKILETPTPIIKDNAILNHVPSTLYFGDLTVNDTDGTFTGSGKVTALRNGYSMSQEAIA